MDGHHPSGKFVANLCFIVWVHGWAWAIGPLSFDVVAWVVWVWSPRHHGLPVFWSVFQAMAERHMHVDSRPSGPSWRWLSGLAVASVLGVPVAAWVARSDPAEAERKSRSKKEVRYARWPASIQRVSECVLDYVACFSWYKQHQAKVKQEPLATTASRQNNTGGST